MRPRKLPRESLAMNPKAIARRTIDAENRKGFNEAHHPQLQREMIPVAEQWLAHWLELIVESPMSTAGPLASLLANAVHEAHQEAQATKALGKEGT
jgi:hypothetical protein